MQLRVERPQGRQRDLGVELTELGVGLGVTRLSLQLVEPQVDVGRAPACCCFWAGQHSPPRVLLCYHSSALLHSSPCPRLDLVFTLGPGNCACSF